MCRLHVCVKCREWGSLIGKVEDVSVANGVMKVRVRINITRPLKRGLRVAIDEKGTNVSLLFQYEHLPKFCYDCGIIGHKALDCPLKDFQEDKIGAIQSGRYGPWMSAPSSPPRVQRQWGGSKQTEIGGESHFMNMKEVGKIVEAVKSSWRRRNLVEEVAVISGLESQAREEEIFVTLDLPGPMSILCWNARELENPGVVSALQTFMRKHSPSLVFLSETKFCGNWAERRLIHDNIMVNFELLHSLFKRNNGRRGFMALKLDMSKAYDRVEWFPASMMRQFNFTEGWVRVIIDCVMTPQYTLLINGRPKGRVILTRGLCQGCPLSPYLFIFYAESLSSLFSLAEARSELMGFWCFRSGPRVTHLFFEDDSLVFGRAKGGDTKTIKRILLTYEAASG
uniref:CCHC-type domain-containing protein n=1 Tax=Cannabis sativa TaxID=3483 RepID=A0A803QJX1_CANSA